MTRPLLPYDVKVRRPGEDPITIGILAYGPAEAITCAQELYPNHLISTALLAPQWLDPA